MIKIEIFATREDGVTLVRTYSDQGMMIEQEGTGARYEEAIDPENSGRSYTETDEPIEEVDEEKAYAEAGRILLGEESENV